MRSTRHAGAEVRHTQAQWAASFTVGAVGESKRLWNRVMETLMSSNQSEETWEEEVQAQKGRPAGSQGSPRPKRVMEAEKRT